MPTAAHTFARSNFDDADETRPSSDFREAVNISLEPGQAYPATGNVVVRTLVPPSTGLTLSLGSIEDEDSDTAIVFYFNSDGRHRLVRYNPASAGGAGQETLVLEWAGLNLSPYLVLQGRVLGGILVYRDAAGEPRAVPLARAEAGTFTPAYLAREPFALHLVKVPPLLTPLLTRQPATGADPREALRIIQGKAYQFSYRWHYIDGEVTPFATYSPWLDVLTDPAAVTFNSIVVTLPGPVPAGVVQVDVLVREAESNIWQVADSLLRNSAGVLASTFTFYGQLAGGATTEAETTKLYENCWPCEALEIAGSRVFEANLLEGYPTPEPAFTATVVNANSDTTTLTLYTLDVEGFVAGDPAQDGSPTPDVPVSYQYYYSLASGTYPDPASTYQPLGKTVANGRASYTATGPAVSYEDAFVTPTAPNESHREVTVGPVTFTPMANLSTFHELSPYRVSVQFYDALGRSAGCSPAKTVFIPKQDIANMHNRGILVTLTTTDLAALNAEIPAWAMSYRFLISRNDRTLFFLQGRAADVVGYGGHKTIINETNGDVDEVELFVDGTRQPHQKLRIDIGNWPAAGQGFNYQSGSGAIVRFIQDEKEFPVTGQYGDYLEVAWDGYPLKSLDAAGNAQARLEVYLPNTTSGQIFYERGPHLQILRTGSGSTEQRRYAQTSLVLDGDCFLVPLAFPLINRAVGYDPPNKKEYVSGGDKLLIESMVPPYRLAPVANQRIIVHEKQQKGAFDGFFGIKNQESVNVSSATETLADNTNRTTANLLWLDASYGGRPGVAIPKELQQVRRNIIRFSNPKQNGNRINGLGSFEALNFYDKLPQELGAVVRLSVADQAQADGTVLLVNQTQGPTSLYLGQQPIQADPNTQLLAITDKVIGGANTLRGGYGCVDAGTVVRENGVVFYYSRERRELVRYNKGIVALALEYKYRTRLAQLADRYGNSRITGCYDPNRQEYLLTYHGNDDYPGVTLVWSERRQAWADQLAFVPTAGSGVNNELITWLNADLYRHVASAPVGTFFGNYTAPAVTFVPASPFAKTWQAIGVRSQAPWQATRLTTPAGQASRILRPWMRFVQGVWRAAIRRDENSSLDHVMGLHSGRVLQSESVAVTLTCPEANPAPLVGATVDYLINTGQSANQ